MNKSSVYPIFFNVPMFLDMLILLTVLNHAKIEPQLLLKCLYVFAFGSIVLTIMYLLGIQTGFGLQNRVTIFGNNQNEVGLKLCISILILISIIQENRLKFGKFRFLFYAVIPFMFMFLIGTASRVAFISLFFGVIIFYLLHKQFFAPKKIFIILLLTITLFPVLYVYLNKSLLTERLGDFITKGDLSSRDVVWSSILKIIPQNFLWGQGETGCLRSITLLLGYPSSPHSVILEILCYTGIIGLILFLIFFVRIIICIKRSFQEDKEFLPLILIFPVLGMILSGQILGAKIVWVLFAYMISPFVSRSYYKFGNRVRNQTKIVRYKPVSTIIR
jgi:O-antigen ligase